MTDAAELKSELAQFTGTEQYFRHGLVRNVVYTDGVKHFAEKAGAYWLLDILATELPAFVKKHEIIFVTATAKDGKATLEAVRDTGQKTLWTKKIDFTDLPDGEWPLWFAVGGPGGTLVIMIPSEY
jgi:hypothetical protein